MTKNKKVFSIASLIVSGIIAIITVLFVIIHSDRLRKELAETIKVSEERSVGLAVGISHSYEPEFNVGDVVYSSKVEYGTFQKLIVKSVKYTIKNITKGDVIDGVQTYNFNMLIRYKCRPYSELSYCCDGDDKYYFEDDLLTERMVESISCNGKKK